jgi:hypothetical protein
MQPGLQVRIGEAAGSERSGPWQLVISDYAGRLVARRASQDPRSQPLWDFRNDAGRPVPGGRYFYQLHRGLRKASGNILILD